ncbi:SHOCT domain-containing protein [Kitasatospora cinereorecta]|uniref:SHOCT domain-containing protein n=1 Tax=Kitasatospora cinereorecta TaxID=285560 RepID=A0ABW0VM20_9ACTN
MRHYWNHGPHGGWSWVVPGITVLLLWLVLVAVLVLLWRTLSRRGGAAAATPPWGRAPAAPGAEQTLAERLARGEIDVDDYHARLAALRATGPPPPAGAAPPPPDHPPEPPPPGPPPPGPPPPGSYP